MKPTFLPWNRRIAYGGKNGLPVRVSITLADRNLKLAPAKPVPSWQPSVGWQPPFCIRLSSFSPSSNSWLPTEVRPSPSRFIASIVGSSWKSAESSGLAPIRSPAATTSAVAMPLAELLQVAAEDPGAACGDRRRGGLRPASDGRMPPVVVVCRVPVEVVHGQQLDLDVLGLVVMVVVALVRRGRAGEDEQKHAGRPQQAKE